MINTSTDAGVKKDQISQFVDPGTANYRNLPIAVMDILMEVFVDFDESQKPWT